MKHVYSLILLLCCALQLHAAALAAADYAAPRTEWDQPDLQGVWNFSSEVAMQRPAEFGERAFLNVEEIAASQGPRLQLGDRPRRSPAGAEDFYNDNMWVENAGIGGNVRTSLIIYPPNGQLPPRVAGVEYLPGGEVETPGQRPVRFVIGGIGRNGPEDRGLSERCLVGFNAGPQLMPSVYNNNVQIIQNRDHVVLLTEMVHDARIIALHTGPRPALDASLGQWSGDSRGHWEGDTLVIETRNFNGLTQSFDGYGTSAHKRLTERITRIGPATLHYEFTIEDPATFTDRLTAVVPLTRIDTQLYEYACHEGNYGMANMLRAARSREANAVSDRVADLFRGQ